MKNNFDMLKECTINEDKQGGLMLDFGCGEGLNMQSFSRRYQCIGIDVSIQDLKLAKKHGTVILCTGTALPFKDNSFDIIVSQEVLHHVDNVSTSIDEINRCLKTECVLLIRDTVEDSLIIRIGRDLHPSYKGIPVKSRFYRRQLLDYIQQRGFVIEHYGETKLDKYFERTFRWLVRPKIHNTVALKILNIVPIFIDKSLKKIENVFGLNLSTDCFCKARKIKSDNDRNIDIK